MTVRQTADPLSDDLDDEPRPGALHLWRISSVGLDPEAAALHDQQLLGTDLMFFTAFLGGWDVMGGGDPVVVIFVIVVFCFVTSSSSS